MRGRIHRPMKPFPLNMHRWEKETAPSNREVPFDKDPTLYDLPKELHLLAPTQDGDKAPVPASAYIFAAWLTTVLMMLLYGELDQRATRFVDQYTMKPATIRESWSGLQNRPRSAGMGVP